MAFYLTILLTYALFMACGQAHAQSPRDEFERIRFFQQEGRPSSTEFATKPFTNLLKELTQSQNKNNDDSRNLVENLKNEATFSNPVVFDHKSQNEQISNHVYSQSQKISSNKFNEAFRITEFTKKFQFSFSLTSWNSDTKNTSETPVRYTLVLKNAEKKPLKTRFLIAAVGGHDLVSDYSDLQFIEAREKSNLEWTIEPVRYENTNYTPLSSGKKIFSSESLSNKEEYYFFSNSLKNLPSPDIQAQIQLNPAPSSFANMSAELATVKFFQANHYIESNLILSKRLKPSSVEHQTHIPLNYALALSSKHKENGKLERVGAKNIFMSLGQDPFFNVWYIQESKIFESDLTIRSQSGSSELGIRSEHATKQPNENDVSRFFNRISFEIKSNI